MERQRKRKFIIMITLMVVVSAMSLGYAAFSTTLNISSSASVTPNSSSFYLGFYPSNIPSLDDGTISPSTTGGATGNNITVDAGSTTITGLKANFTEPGQTIVYSFYVGNESEYDAYLRAINFLNVSGQSKNKVCTPGTGTTASLVDATCEAITMTVEVDGTIATDTKTNISGKSLAKGNYVQVTITITYAESGARADGPFNVEFGGISLDYSTVDREVTLIKFTVNGNAYTAEEGMIWADFINSQYNSNDDFVLDSSYGTGFKFCESAVFSKGCNTIYSTDVINSNVEYGDYSTMCA